MSGDAPAVTTTTDRTRARRSTPEGHIKVFKTAVFKFHNPSQHKRAMLRDATKRAHLAYGKLLASYLPGEDEVARLMALPKRERRREFFLTRARLEKEASKSRQLSIGAKAAVAREVAAQIASTIELQDVQEEVGAPTVTRINATQTEYETALREFATAIDLPDEKLLRNELNRIARMGQRRPLGFYKVRPGDGFLLLRHPETDRLYCWLNLHPKDGRFADPVHVRDLVNMQTGEVMSFRSSTGALFPLEMGHGFHGARFLYQGRPQTARLVHRTTRDRKACDEFELHVAFEFTAQKKAPGLWLGVDRGIYNLAAYAVVDDNGNLVTEGSVSGMTLRALQRKTERRVAGLQRRGRVVRLRKRRAWADEAVHVAANEIVECAAEHSARVVIEDLKNLSGVRRKKRVPGTRRGGFNRLLGRVQYEKFRKVLEYKLAAQGLPKPLLVRAAGTSQTCPECSHWSRDNRKKAPSADGFDMDTFSCVKCGFTADADMNAARVIAIKGRWLPSLPTKAERGGKPLPDSLSFATLLRDCAERRMGA